jgi:geranylgeranyl diphosphate synthase type II
MQQLEALTQLYGDYLANELAGPALNGPADGLYAPQRYLLELGGKRLRPVLVLLGTQACGADPRAALPAAHAVELFHNFSLIHDDIMDAAPLRRGKPTVHTRWNTNTAILSGDAMLVLAYQSLAKLPSDVVPAALHVFNRTALEVCEGQQWDMEFETQEGIREEDYLRMIQYKTSVLLGCALQLGALVAGASAERSEALYRFGLSLGTSFQIHDDLLDAFGEPGAVGKQVGGDLLANKKTLLFLRLQNAAPEALHPWLQPDVDPEAKVQTLCALLESSGVRASVEEERANHFADALEALNQSGLGETGLRAFAQAIWDRKF